LILPFLIGVALGASRAETPESYMERLYGNYHDPSFNPLTHPQLYFTPRLVTALKEDSRLAHGEAGYLDGDPVCQCQDTAGLHAAITGVTQEASDKAEVRVSIGFAGYDSRPATFRLIMTKAGWRIDDVSSADDPSLLRSIEASNRAQRSKQSQSPVAMGVKYDRLE